MTVIPIVATCEICCGPFERVKFVRHDNERAVAMCFQCANAYADDYAKTNSGSRPSLEQYHQQPNGRWQRIDLDRTEPEDL